jgi:pimeloyl-ACP methyl ester carboxylesterase
MLPFSILRIWILGLVAFAIAISAGYLAWDWHRYDRDQEQLYWAIGLGAVALTGRYAIAPLVGLGAGPPPLNEESSEDITAGDGTRLHVRTLRRGAGPVVVLIHGWTLDSSVWSYAQQELPGDCELMAWDLRGLGKSSAAPSGDYSLDAMAADLRQVIKPIAGRPILLVGHSIGGMICQTFARLYREELGPAVRGMVVCETTHTNPLRTARLAPLWRALQKPLIEPLLHVTVWMSPLVRIMNVMSYLNGTTHLTTRITSFAGTQTWRQVDLAARLSSFASPAVAARGMLAMLRFDESRELPQLGVPVLVIAGANDRLTVREAGEAIASTAPRGELAVIDPAGHLSILERHGAVNSAISSFADRCGRQLNDQRVTA